MKPAILVLTQIHPDYLPLLQEEFDTTCVKPEQRQTVFSTDDVSRFHVVVTNAAFGLTAAEMDLMPKLELICCMGVGHEGIDVDAARARNIPLCNGAHTNDFSVADHAMALLLALIRNVPELDRLARQGKGRAHTTIRPAATGKRLGILGLGSIGAQVARRAGGFDMPVGYHNRHAKDGLPYTYFDSPLALATWSDCVVIAAPGGPSTAKMVDAAFLSALGPNGYLVNVGRGSIVDNAALIDALGAKRLGGAALDVFEGEPTAPAALLALPNVILTPHVAGWSPESIKAMVQNIIVNITRHFAGEPLLTPI